VLPAILMATCVISMTNLLHVQRRAAKVEQEVVETVSTLTYLSTTSNDAPVNRNVQLSRLSNNSHKRRRILPASTKDQSPLLCITIFESSP